MKTEDCTNNLLEGAVEKKLIQSIYNKLPVGVEIFNLDGTLRSINAMALHQYGAVNENAIRGWNVFDDMALPAAAKAKLRLGRDFSFDVEYDNSVNKMWSLVPMGIRHYHVDVSFFSEEPGKLSGFIFTSIDFTAQTVTMRLLKKKNETIEKARNLRKLILGNINSGLVFLDKDFTVVWQNISRVFDSPKRDGLYEQGKICYTFFGRTAPCELCPVLRAMQSNNAEYAEIHDPNGMVLDYNAVPVYTDDENAVLKGYLLRVDNSTERFNLNQQLLDAKEKAEESDRLKSAFLANISHEIRTPLNAIVGFSDLAMHTEDMQEREEYMHIIEVNNELLLNLINDVLDLSRIESGSLKFELTSLDMCDTMQMVYHTLNQRERKPGVELLLDSPYEQCSAKMDKNRLMQVLVNMGVNAIKYTEKGFIRIGYRVQNNGIYAYVEDTGRGIAPENCTKVFDRFEKLNSFVQGTGLGLSICKALVDAVNGKIGVESEPGKGSKFWFWVPCVCTVGENDTDKVVPSHDPVLKKQNGEKIRFLVTDDNLLARQLAQALLQDYACDFAVNGEEALELLGQQSYDVILMDIHMPGVDGIEVIQRVRETDRDVYIVALTDNVFDPNKDRALYAGCNAVLAKPLKKQELFDLINLSVSI